jgi:hypothetical protein
VAEQRVRGGAEALSGGAGRLRCRASVTVAGTRVRAQRGVGLLLVRQRRDLACRPGAGELAGDLGGGRYAGEERRKGEGRR